MKEQSLELIYENLLMEKDHRQKMMKFGIPEDVANFLHDFDDKYSLWFANQFKAMPEFERAANKLTFVGTRRQQMNEIVDWVRGAQTVNLNEFKWDTALQASQEWHEAIAKSPEEQVLDLTTSAEQIESGTKHEILKVYTDGYYWVDLHSTDHSNERECMGHCGRTNDGETLWSLRHISNFYNKEFRSGGEGKCNSYVTIAVSPSESMWHQAKGKENKKPVGKYWDYIADIFVDHEIFAYNSEYRGGDDFGIEEFKSVIEDNPEKYPNGDEIIEKLNESGIEAKADKLFAEYEDQFTNVQVYYEIGDEQDYINAQGGFTIVITNELMPEIGYLEAHKMEDYWDRKNGWEIQKKREKFLAAITETCDDYNIYPSGDWEHGTPFEFAVEDGRWELQLNFDFEMDRDGGTELDKFKNFLEEMVGVNNTLEENDFKERFVETFKEELVKVNLIPDPEDEDAPPPPKPEDPRQMKFEFGESSTFKDYAKFIGIV